MADKDARGPAGRAGAAPRARGLHPELHRPRAAGRAARGRGARGLRRGPGHRSRPGWPTRSTAAATLAEAGEAFGDPLGVRRGAGHRLGGHRRGGAHAAGPPGASDEHRSRSTRDGPDTPTAPRSPRRGMCAAVLCLEAITLGLTTPVMISVADVDTGTALAIGLGLAVACLLLAGMLRAEWAYSLGWVDPGRRDRPGLRDPADVRARRHLRAAVGHGVLPRPQDRARARRRRSPRFDVASGPASTGEGRHGHGAPAPGPAPRR